MTDGIIHEVFSKPIEEYKGYQRLVEETVGKRVTHFLETIEVLEKTQQELIEKIKHTMERYDYDNVHPDVIKDMLRQLIGDK